MHKETKNLVALDHEYIPGLFSSFIFFFTFFDGDQKKREKTEVVGVL